VTSVIPPKVNGSLSKEKRQVGVAGGGEAIHILRLHQPADARCSLFPTPCSLVRKSEVRSQSSEVSERGGLLISLICVCIGRDATSGWRVEGRSEARGQRAGRLADLRCARRGPMATGVQKKTSIHSDRHWLLAHGH
jgi:hypothetical protein